MQAAGNKTAVDILFVPGTPHATCVNNASLQQLQLAAPMQLAAARTLVTLPRRELGGGRQCRSPLSFAISAEDW